MPGRCTLENQSTFINTRFEGDTVTSRFESMSIRQSAGRLAAER